MSIFEYLDYRNYLKAWIESQPKAGWGVSARLARSLRVSSVFMSQVLGGSRQLSLEQAHDLSDVLGLSVLETRYFLTLIEHDRAGTAALKTYFGSLLAEFKKNSNNLKAHVRTDKELSDSERAIFYSDWRYTALRLATGIETLRTVPALSERFGLPASRVHEMLEFLVKTGLVVATEAGVYTMGPSATHLTADSPLATQRQVAWRLKALEQITAVRPQAKTTDLHYCGPASLSEADAHEFQLELSQLIKKFVNRVSDSKSETLKCLVVDWFHY